MSIKVENFTGAELGDFREAQRISFQCLTETAGRLRPGMSEKDAVAIQYELLGSHGVRSYFHTPVALFGERTALPGRFGIRDFLPTDKYLEPGMAVILDQSPVWRGYTVDTSYTFSMGENPELDAMRKDLLFLRDFILDRVLKEKSFREIYRLVNREIRRLGYVNCHRKHPEGVLGHRVTKVRAGNRELSPPGEPLPRQLAYFRRETRRSIMDPRRPSPNWNVRPANDRPPPPGLWAVEPHIARGDLGAKWEELLLITGTHAAWLSDEVPHAQWARSSSN